MTQTSAPMTSSDSRWADAKIAALRDHDRTATIAALAVSLMFAAAMLLSAAEFHHLAR